MLLKSMKKLIYILLLPLFTFGQTKVNLPTGTQYIGNTGTKVIVTNNTAITNVSELDTANTKAVGRVTVKTPITLAIGGKTYQISADTSTGNIGLATLYQLGLKLSSSDTTGKWWAKSDTTVGGIASFYMNGLKVNINDTSAMLSKYKLKADSVLGSGYASIYKNGLKLNISDTASMLANYYQTSSATSALALKVNISDTGTMLTPYLRKLDTLSLSNRINLKLNISDTTGKWVNSFYRKTASDSVFAYKNGVAYFMFRDSTSGGADSVNLSGRINNAHYSTTAINDSTITLNKPNGSKDTIVFRGAALGSSGLTNRRVLFAGANGVLKDTSGFTWNNYQLNVDSSIYTKQVQYSGRKPPVTAGVMGWDSTQRAFYATSYLVQRSIPLTHGVITADVIDSNSVSEVVLDSIPMAALFPAAGKVIHIQLYGLYTIQNPQTLIIRLRHSNSATGTVLDSIIVSAANTNKVFSIDMLTTFRATGASGSAITRMVGEFNGAWIASSALGLKTINTTSLNTFYVTAKFSANGNNKAKLQQGYVTTID